MNPSLRRVLVNTKSRSLTCDRGFSMRPRATSRAIIIFSADGWTDCIDNELNYSAWCVHIIRLLHLYVPYVNIEPWIAKERERPNFSSLST